MIHEEHQEHQLPVEAAGTIILLWVAKLKVVDSELSAGSLSSAPSSVFLANAWNTAVMPPKEPTKHQVSARLQFQSQTPAFLRAFQNRVSGRRNDEDEDAPQIEGDYGDGEEDEDAVDEFGRSVGRPLLDEFGREVRRAGSAEREKEAKKEQIRRREMEEEEDEKPVVVVLKEGKHLTEFEAENERRKGMRSYSFPTLAVTHLGIT